MMRWRDPAIIAMKGHPFTGKSTIAQEIGMLLRYCAIIRLDTILDSITETNSSSSPPSPDKAKELQEMAFDLLCKITETQLKLGMSVIIDSPLLLESHLSRLINLKTLNYQTDPRPIIIVVECKAEEQYDWQMRFEGREAYDKWYKPSSWNDVEKLIGEYPGDYSVNHPNVSKLTVNVDRQVEVPGVFEAIKELNLRHESRVLDYNQWARHRNHHPEQGPHYSHAVSVFHESINTSFEDVCNFCHEQVYTGDPAYTCNSLYSCQLVLHQKCAEISGKKWEITPQKFPRFVVKQQGPFDEDRYLYPETQACSNCKDEGEAFSYDCARCLFETHLKCALVPTILRHQGHSKSTHHHILFFHMDTVRMAVKYRCTACGGEGKYAKYRCNNIDCDAVFHVECALMPHSANNKHGGHEHVMNQIYSRQGKLMKDYLSCDHCAKKMSPRSWFYYCNHCDLTYHMECMFSKEEANCQFTCSKSRLY